jgi:quercetin dioxygenase-like cupin family protein
VIVVQPIIAARSATHARQDRPASAIVHDCPAVRLVVFRLAPGQSVAPHHSASTVLLQVLAGRGVISGACSERACVEGDVLLFDPGEPHGMRAEDEELLLLAAITPRP